MIQSRPPAKKVKYEITETAFPLNPPGKEGEITRVVWGYPLAESRRDSAYLRNATINGIAEISPPKEFRCQVLDRVPYDIKLEVKGNVIEYSYYTKPVN